MKVRKTLFFTICIFLILFSEILSSTSTYEEGKALNDFYYRQFNSAGLEKNFYDAIYKMYKNGNLKDGVTSIDMVDENFLSQSVVDANAKNNMPLVYALGAAKDAFRLDHPECYYVDFDKLSVRSLSGTKNGKKVNLCLLGIGRTDTYLRDGFTAASVTSTLTEYESLLSTAISQITGDTIKEKIISVHDYVVKNMNYKLEINEGVTDIYTLRTAYGALKNKQGMCETFSVLFKVLVDKLNIPCISIIGRTYDQSEEGNEHMWNNCYLDGKWWAVDTTYDNGLNKNTFRLADGTVMTYHVPDKYLSEAKYPFVYPAIYIEPKLNSGNWIANGAKDSKEDRPGVIIEYDCFNVSYKGMGYLKAREQGIYIVYQFMQSTDKDYPDTWTGIYYEYEGSYLYTDNGNSFLYWYSGATFSKVRFAVTKTPTDYGASLPTSQVEDISDSLSNNSPNLVSPAPYVIYASPHSQERLEIGKGYDVKFEFNEDLELTADLKLEITNSATIKLTDVYYENLEFTSPRTVTFRFYTSKRFEGNAIFYTFNLLNIRGKDSKKQPATYQLFVLNDSNIGCPLKYGMTYTTFGQATLIENRDLRTTGWKYEDDDGNEKEVTKDLSVGVSLIVSKPSTEIQDELNGQVKTSKGVRSTSTYDINLLLCCIRMKFLPVGQRVKIMVPFPEGYGPDDAGVDFEAYHYNNSTKEMEKVTCLVTEGGLILYIDHFSPFVVAAVDAKEDNTKSIMTITNEGGSIEKSGNTINDEIIKLNKGESHTFTVVPNTGKVVDYATLDGGIVDCSDNKITISYDQINKKTGILEVFFITETTKTSETTNYQAQPLIPTAEAPIVNIAKDDKNQIISNVTGSLGSLIYTWYKNDKVINGAVDSIYTLSQNESGVFKLVVTNMIMRSYAKTTSNSLEINIEELDNKNNKKLSSYMIKFNLINLAILFAFILF